MAETIGGLADLSSETMQQIRDLVSTSYKNPVQDRNSFQRDITTSLGLVNYDLQAPSKMIVPVITPFLNMTPRVGGNGGIATNWKQVTGLNTTGLEGVAPEGGRAGRVQTTSAPKSANYATVGQEDSVTFEADSAGQGFEDVRATTAMRLLLATKISQERMLLLGNSTIALSTPGAPTVTGAHDTATPGNFLNSTAYVVKCVALTGAGWRNSSLAGGVPGLISFTAPDGKTVAYGGGSSNISADGAITTGSGADNYSLSASVPVVLGAIAYAWYAGVNAGAARLAAITNINSVVITTVPLTPRQLASAITGDHSQNALAYDGLLPQAFANGLVVDLATGVPGTGTPLTSNNAAGIVEIDSFLKTIWDTQRVSPTLLVANSQEIKNINAKVIAGGSAPLFRFNIDGGGSGEVVSGRVVGNFFNPFTSDGGQLVKVMLHPDMPPGTIMALTDRIPGMVFPGSNLGNLWEMHVRRDYYQIEWPARTREYETGVYAEEVLVTYFPASMAVLTNIANG